MRAGVMQQPPGLPAPSHWLPYIRVADCDATTAKATQLGARSIVMPPTDIPNVGRFAVLIDPVGAAIAVTLVIATRTPIAANPVFLSALLMSLAPRSSCGHPIVSTVT